jgi:serine protease Do
MFNTVKKSLGLICLTAIGGFAGAGVYKYFEKDLLRTIEQKQQVQLTNFTAPPPEAAIDFTKAADLTVHAVVHIKTFYQQQSSGVMDPFQQFFFGNQGYSQAPQQPVEASGSGVIITDDGYIATNNHVVDNADKIEVTLNDKRNYTAKVVGTDPSSDLALLKIDEKQLPFVPYGNSDNVKVGQWVLAVGNPFNLTSTVTAGIVSAKGRNINALSDEKNQMALESYIQTDAAVNRGNSGGALVDTQGQLIGINSAIASTTGVYAGYSFAIPVSIVKKVMNDLLEYGEVQRALIGVSIRDLDAKLAEEKNIKDIRGVYIAGVTENGSAQSAGIKEGDIITKIGEVAVNTSPELQEQVSKFRPGDKINITLIRDGKEKTLSVTLKNKNGNTDIVKTDKKAIISLLGANFEEINDQDRSRLRISNGVKIKSLNGGILRSSGIREGFIITSIDKKAVRSTDDLMNALNNKKGGILLEGIYPNGIRAYYGLGI